MSPTELPDFTLNNIECQGQDYSDFEGDLGHIVQLQSIFLVLFLVKQ